MSEIPQAMIDAALMAHAVRSREIFEDDVLVTLGAAGVTEMLGCVEELRWIVKNMPGVFPAATAALARYDASQR